MDSQIQIHPPGVITTLERPKKFRIFFPIENVENWPNFAPNELKSYYTEDPFYGNIWVMTLDEYNTPTEYDSMCPSMHLCLHLVKVRPDHGDNAEFPVSVQYGVYWVGSGNGPDGTKTMRLSEERHNERFSGVMSQANPMIRTRFQVPYDLRARYTFLPTITFQDSQGTSFIPKYIPRPMYKPKYLKIFRQQWKAYVETKAGGDGVVVIQTPEGDVNVHEKFLTAHSDVLKTQLKYDNSPDWTSEAKNGTKTVSISDYDLDTIQRFVEFVTTGQILDFETCSFDNAFDLLQLSTQFLIRGLKTVSEIKVAEKATTPEHIVKLGQFSRLDVWNGSKLLENKFEEFIFKNPLTVIRSEQLLELIAKEQVDIIGLKLFEGLVVKPEPDDNKEKEEHLEVANEMDQARTSGGQKADEGKPSQNLW